jgi:1,4-dihydroxy-2-naphthoate octaprenyltransferase
MLQASTVQLLRIKFSFFLMPVFWFALSQVEVEQIQILDTIILFILLHLIIYTASYGYNSYMDRDTESIGGLKNPKLPTKELFYVTIIMDILALIISAFIDVYCIICVIGFIAASRAYSYRGIRLKKYPIIGFLVTILFQGSLVYFLVYHVCQYSKPIDVPLLPLFVSALLIGSFYPLTQVYQHDQDKADNVHTLSMILGIRGTFIFTGIVFFLAMTFLWLHFFLKLEPHFFYIIVLCMVPVFLYFVWWMMRVWKNKSDANFENTMRMNIIASICTNTAFISVLLIEKL